MANFPTAMDGPSTLYSPVDAFSAKPLETTAAGAIGAGDSTVSVASTVGGFAATYGILSIDDELIVYTAKTGTQFTGCQRGAFGTTAAAHASGVAVKANMVSGFITALQSAVLAIESEIGTAAARNYVLKNGAVTITGLKTLKDGAEFGTGNKAATGLVRLPNLGAVKWRKADNSGDLGMALNASDHVAMDAIIDFAAGQTFGAFSYPDATTTSKGIVQVDSVGGIAVAAGVISLANTTVTPGTYPKVTVDAKGRATAGAALLAGDLPAHTHVATDIVSGAFGVARGGTGFTNYTLGDLLYCSATDTLAKLAGNTAATRKFLRQTGTGSVSAAPAWDALLSGDLPTHTHAESDVTSLVTDLAGKAASVHTHAESDVTGLVTDLATKAAKAGDTFTGTLRIGGDQAYLECGPYQTVGGVFENMAKYSEDFSVGTWDKNGGSCSVAANATTAPDGNSTADTITAVTTTPIIQQQIAGLTSGGQYTFYVWAKVASGTKQVSIAIVDNAYAGYLAGPTSITLTTAWQRFKITGTLAGGQTGLWIVVRQFAGNSDNWTSGAIYLWGACLQQGNDPKNGYARTWASQTTLVAAGIASGAVVISAKDNAESPLRVFGPGSNLADNLLFAVNSAGEVTIAGGTGNGYMLSQLRGAVNPNGWAGVIEVKNPAGVTAGYLLLYTNP